MRFRFLSMLLAWGLLSSVCHAQPPTCDLPVKKAAIPIAVAAFVFPPSSYIDDQGELAGVSVDTIRAVLGAMGYKPHFVIMPFRRSLAAMKDGAVALMLPCLVTQGRIEFMRFSDPVYQVDFALWKRGRDISTCWEDINDLEGLRIGASNGYAYGPQWDRAVKEGVFSVDMVSSKTPEEAHFHKMLEGRTDMFICERSLGEFIKQRRAPLFDDIHPCPRSVGPVRSLRVPISLKYFDDCALDPDQFLDKFNAVLATFLSGGK